MTFFAMKKTEAERVVQAHKALAQICTGIELEYEFRAMDDSCRFRVDLKGELPNGEFVLVEVKAFNDSAAPYVDAIIQAASYADAIRYPVFIGPIEGSRETMATGDLKNGLAALHLMAGRLNVGFLCVNHRGIASLLLRGQRLAGAEGVHQLVTSHWGFIRRQGSQKVRM